MNDTINLWTKSDTPVEGNRILIVFGFDAWGGLNREEVLIQLGATVGAKGLLASVLGPTK